MVSGMVSECEDVGVTGAGSTKREPTVVGKPAEFMLANIADTFGLRRNQICMVGDRLDTDVLFGQHGGLTTMLVLSGGASIPCPLCPPCPRDQRHAHPLSPALLTATGKHAKVVCDSHREQAAQTGRILAPSVQPAPDGCHMAAG